MDVNYKMGDTVLVTTINENDLGVTLSACMNVSEHYDFAASNCKQIIGLIKRNLTHKKNELIIPLNKEIIRPYVDYCIQAWIQYRKKDLETLARIQRRWMIPELRDLSYEERECGLTTLHTRG